MSRPPKLSPPEMPQILASDEQEGVKWEEKLGKWNHCPAYKERDDTMRRHHNLGQKGPKISHRIHLLVMHHYSDKRFDNPLMDFCCHRQHVLLAHTTGI